MATTKTIQPTGETINLPEMTDRPDMSVVSTSLGKVVDAVNSDNASLIKTEEALAIISTGNTHGAINAGQYVYVRAHSTLAEGLYLASANVAANGTLSGSNVTAVSGGGLNALNSKIENIKPVGFLTFKEKDITAVPKVFPIYNNSDTYEFISHAVTNAIGARAIFIIRLDKTTGDVIVDKSLNMGPFVTYTNFDATYISL